MIDTTIKPHYKPIFDLEKAFYEMQLGIPIPNDSWFYKQQIFHKGRLYCSFKVTDHGLSIVRLNKAEFECIKSKNKVDVGDNILNDDKDAYIDAYIDANIEDINKLKKDPYLSGSLILASNIPESMPMIHKMIRQNKACLISMENEAIDFIRRINKDFSVFKYIGFSAGKDSMVVAELVRRAIGKIPILHNDTTIEIPDTKDMIQRFQKFYDWPITIAKHNKSFFDELAIHSFPSATQRWCCQVMKNEVIMEYVNGKPALAFLGIRAQESPLRAKRSRIDQNNPYMKNQVAAHPILNWSTLDVWIYTFWRNIPINDAYKKGFARVGCFLCPVASLMNHLLMDYYYPKLWQKWLHCISAFISYRHNIRNIEFRKGEKWVYTVSRAIKNVHVKCLKCHKIICWKGKRYNLSQNIPARKWCCLSCHAKKQGIPKRYLRKVIDKKIIRANKINFDQYGYFILDQNSKDYGSQKD